MDDNKIIIYQDDNDITRVSVRFADEDLWLTQNQLAEIYDICVKAAGICRAF